jgi:hypothetical protein
MLMVGAILFGPVYLVAAVSCSPEVFLERLEYIVSGGL